MAVPGVPDAIRNDNVVENYKQIQKDKPYLTFEYGVQGILTIFTLHDYSMFHVLEEEFGTEKAVNLYASVWKRRTDLEFPGLKEAVGLGKDDPVSMDKLTEIMQVYFEIFGNPIYVTEKTDERVTFRVTDCPYTTQVLWNMYSHESNLAYNDKIQVSCNTAIFDRFLEITGLDKEWTFGFPSQLCRSGAYCEFTFVRKHF